MLRTKTKGQALTEFALILPILLLLLLGIIEGARIIWAYVQVQNAAREAARYAVTGQPSRRPGSAFDGDCLLVEGNREGDPWACTDAERAAAIKQVAVNYATGLGISAVAIANAAEYEAYASTPGAFGVLVKGQRTATDTEGEADYPGRPGLNVLVQAYYNVRILDPIYATILPRDWVRVNAQVVMQNEGVDTTASGLAPVGLGAAPPPVGGGDPPPSGTRTPRISIVESQPVPAGTTITIWLEDHDPSTTYDVFFDSQLCGTVTTSAQFFAQLTCYIPVSTPAGEHGIHSELPGTGSAVATAPIDVEQPTEPAIYVVGGTRWPAGSPITIGIRKHDPNTTYRIRFAGSEIGTITTNASGEGTRAYTIDPDQPEGTVTIESLTMDGSFSPANTTIVIVDPDIIVQGGTVWPSGTRIYIFLRDHAPNQTYSVYFGTNQVTAGITTNGIGEAILSYVIPSHTPDGTYTLRSEQGGSTIAEINISVSTPPTPFIVVVGGYEWPAGSPITIQLRKHSPNMSYNVYFGPNLVGGSPFTVDGNGEYTIAYVIPVTLSDGVYNLRSVRTDNGNQEATVNVTVTAVPNITVDGGFLHAPGTTITIRLNQHAPNAAYDVYLGGVKIGTVITGGSGEASLTYNIPANAIPGDYPLESKPQGGTEIIASATLTVLTPDLTVVNIETPAHPVFNTDMPITITLRNMSDKDIVNQYFDVDVYVDPTLAPSVGDAGLPPGVTKYWYNTVPASGTLTIYDTVTLWGPKVHHIYARADTSGNILEQDETNNILGTLVAPASCALEIADEFEGSGMPAGWGSAFYGNANPSNSQNYTPPEVYQTGGALFVKSDGRDTTQADDNGSSGGYAYVYREASGDFDVQVQVVSNAYSYSSNRRSGLEVRDDLGGTSAKVNLLLTDSGNDRIRLATRTNSSVAVAYPSTPNPDHPVWMRLMRRGSTFSAYYAPGTASVPPQPGEWIFIRDVSVSMNGTVYVGVVNAAQYYSSTRSRNWSSSTFDHFHYCGDPAGALTCGEVQETGGAVFIDAVNYTDSVIRGGQAWTQTTRAGLAGVHVPSTGVMVDSSDLNWIAANSPQLEYQVKFTTPGRYYIAVLGWGPDTSGNSVHLGLNGSLTANTDDIDGLTTTSTNPPQWLRNAGWYVDIPSAGSYSINLFMREDGAQVYKIALFTQVDYPLSGFGPAQSECTVTAPSDIPPGFNVCNQMLVNGDFEGDLLDDVLPYWIMADQEFVGRTSVHYLSPGTSFGVIMPSSSPGGSPKQPWMYQEFAMPDWVLTTTTAVLDLQKGVDWLGTPNNEPLHFYLRTTGGISLTVPITVATGQDLPDLDPFNYNNTQWSHLVVDVAPSVVAAGYNLVNFAAQPLQAYFFSPNPGGNSTEFYLDKIELDVCTTQPMPDPINNSLGGKTMLNQSLRPGTDVWAYKMQSGGAAGGPVYTTYSIQDGTYHFYNLPAGTYLIYAEYWLGGTRYSAQTVATVAASGNVTRDLVLNP